VTISHRLFVLSGALLAGVVVINASVSAERLPPRSPLSSLADNIGRWKFAGDVVIDDDSLRVLNANDYVSRSYESPPTSLSAGGPGAVDLFIAYYGSQRQGETMHSPLNCLPATGWEPMSAQEISIDAHPSAVAANRLVIQKGLDRQLVIYWYQSHGRTIASEYASKAYLVLDSIRLHRSDAALVRIVAPADSDAAASDFIRALRPVLSRYIPD
jgi:EpsI family protein